MHAVTGFGVVGGRHRRARCGCAPANAGPARPPRLRAPPAPWCGRSPAGGALGRACHAEAGVAFRGTARSERLSRALRRRRADPARGPARARPRIRRPAPAPRPAGRGPARDRRTGRADAGAAARVPRRPECPPRRRSSRPRHAACATAVRATTRSARMPSTSNAAHSAAMRRNSSSGSTTSADQRTGGGDPAGQIRVVVGVPGGEPLGVGLERPCGADHLHAHVDVAGRAHVDRQPEPVEQLRTQFALFGIHRADEHEPGVVAVRDAVALDVHPAHRRGVEQHVDQVVVQQVDLVDVQHAAVRARQQPRRERVLAVAQHPLQVQRSDHAVLGGADRQLDQSGVARRRRPARAPGRAPPSTSRCPSRRGSARRRSRAAPRTAPAPAAAGPARRAR